MMKKLLEKTRALVYHAIQMFSARAEILEGVPIGGTHAVSILFIGHCGFHDYIKYFFPHRTIIPLGRYGVLRMIWRMRNIKQKSVDVCFVNAPAIFRSIINRYSDAQFYQSMGQEIQTPDWASMHSMFSKSKKTLSNKFARGVEGVTCRRSTEPGDFDFFYEQMFRPLMIRKYGVAARMQTLAEMKADFIKGFLLLLENDTTVLAGALLVPEGKKLIFQRIGVLNGDERLVAKGVQSLAYYYQLRYAVQNGFQSLDAMNSAPFLSDGVFKHKAEWGARPYFSGGAGRIGYLTLGAPSVRQADFFRLLPLIVRHSENFAVLVGLPDGTGASEAWVKSFVQGHPVRGIKHLIPVHPVSGVLDPIDLGC